METAKVSFYIYLNYAIYFLHYERLKPFDIDKS